MFCEMPAFDCRKSTCRARGYPVISAKAVNLTGCLLNISLALPPPILLKKLLTGGKARGLD